MFSLNKEKEISESKHFQYSESWVDICFPQISKEKNNNFKEIIVLLFSIDDIVLNKDENLLEEKIIIKQINEKLKYYFDFKQNYLYCLNFLEKFFKDNKNISLNLNSEINSQEEYEKLRFHDICMFPFITITLDSYGHIYSNDYIEMYKESSKIITYQNDFYSYFKELKELKREFKNAYQFKWSKEIDREKIILDFVKKYKENPHFYPIYNLIMYAEYWSATCKRYKFQENMLEIFQNKVSKIN